MKIFSSKFIFPVMLAFLAVQMLDPNLVLAASGTDVGDNDVLKGFAQLLSVFVNLFTFLALLLLNYGGDLLGTEFLTAATPMEAIRPMWVIIRNITNVGFVLVLLFLAFSNLFNFGDGGGWTIKEKLPKIIFALIAVNFSLLGFRVLIDAVHVGTITLLSIPQTALETKGAGSVKKLLEQGINEKGMRCGVSEEGGDDDPKNGESSCQYFYTRINYLLCKDSFDDKGMPNKGKNISSQSDCLFRIKDLDGFINESKSMTAHNLFLAFGIFFQKLEQLPALAAELDSWTGVITNVLFSGILAMAYVVSLIAIFIALLFRMVVLWLAMVFSPLIVAAGIMGFGGGGGELGGKVVTNLIMPLKIAAAFAVSFIMIAAMIDVVPQNSGNFFEFGPALGQFSSNGYGLLWQITTVIVFWTAAFWALKGTEGQWVIDKVEGAATKAGGFVARATTIDRQIFTMPGAGKDGEKPKASMAGLLSMPMATVDKGIKQQKGDRDKFLASMGLMDDGAVEAGKALRDLSRKIAGADSSLGKTGKVGVLDTHLRDNGGTTNFFDHPSEAKASINALSIDKTIKDNLNGYIDSENHSEFDREWKKVLVKYSDITTPAVNYKTGDKTSSGEESNKVGEDSTITIKLAENKERIIKFDITAMQNAADKAGNINNDTVLKNVLNKGGIQSSDIQGLTDSELNKVVNDLQANSKALGKAKDVNVKKALKAIRGEEKQAEPTVTETPKPTETPPETNTK